MKVILEYDETTGEISDATGLPIATYYNLQSFQEENSSSTSSRDNIDKVAHLMSLGFTKEEVISMIGDLL